MNGAATDIDVIDDVPSESPGATAGVSRSQAVTERLLDAAVEVFAERGFEAARVAEIARRADLTTGAIYARWRGKRALIVDAVRHVVPQFMHLSVAAADAPAPETLVALGTSLMDTLNLNPPTGLWDRRFGSGWPPGWCVWAGRWVSGRVEPGLGCCGGLVAFGVGLRCAGRCAPLR